MKHFFKKSLASFISLAILLGSFGGLLYLGEGKGASAAFYSVQAPATTLYYGISSSASSARLRSFNDIYGTKLTMAMFGTIGYVTFEPGVPGKEEVVSFTGITDNGDGTQTITGLTRGLISRGPTYGLGGTGRYHGSNTYVTVSNAGEFYNQFAIKQNNESVTGIWNFNTVLPVSSLIATTSTQFVTKALLDGTVAAGVATATESSFGGVWLATALQAASSTPTTANTPYVMQAQNATDTPTAGCATGYTSTAGAGCSVIATLAGKIKQTFLDIFTTNNTWSGTQTFSATTTINGSLYGGNRFVDYLASTTISGASTPVAVFIATSTNAVWATNANNATTSDFLGFVRQNVTNGATTSVQIDGVVGGFTGLTAGKEYYASTTGVLSTVYNSGTAEIYVGRAVSSTQLLLDRKGDSWQYLGSATCTIPVSGGAGGQCDTSSINFSRFFTANVSISTSNACSGPRAGGGNAQLVVYKIGATSISARNGLSCDDSVGSSTGGWTSTVTFTSTSSARVSITGASGQTVTAASFTAYFYR